LTTGRPTRIIVTPELTIGGTSGGDRRRGESHDRVRAAGIEADAPEDKNYDVRTFNVTDPEGYMWGFMRRLGQSYVPTRSLEEGGLEEILPE
jgi:hypothetical protein